MHQGEQGSGSKGNGGRGDVNRRHWRAVLKHLPENGLFPLSLDSKLTGGCVCKPSRSFKDSDAQVSPTSATGSRLALSPSSTTSNVSLRDHRMSDLAGYRRDLAILDPSGGRGAHNQQGNPSTGSLSQIAPWMAGTAARDTENQCGQRGPTFLFILSQGVM